MPKEKKDIFKTATLKLKKNKIIQSLILSSLIISNAPLIAENIETQTPQTIENETLYELNITCDKEYIEEAKQLKSQLDELQLQNEYGEYIIGELAKNNTNIKITKTNGSNFYFDNTIYINSEKIKDATTDYRKRAVNESVIHEAVHMLQNKDNIMRDIEKLPPKEAVCLYLYAELDSFIKSYLTCDDYYKTDTETKINSLLKSLSNIVSSSMDNYIEKAIYLNTDKEYNTNSPTVKSILEKFNSMGNLPKLDIDNIVNDIYEKIPDDYKAQIQIINNEYLARGNTLLNQKDLNQK
ncbi:hypothetical protein HDR59_04005 [bacterium]|nr:hypothetical protein [bacterium]